MPGIVSVIGSQSKHVLLFTKRNAGVEETMIVPLDEIQFKSYKDDDNNFVAIEITNTATNLLLKRIGSEKQAAADYGTSLADLWSQIEGGL